jgi:hypothetical protein
MTKGGSKYFKIKIDTDTGEIVKKVDENNNPATQVTQQEMDQIYQNQGFKHVATILHAHSSPGCVFLNIGGWAFKICR